ncbi:uncharacterized protein E5676_scaffold110G002380 [Cucumis melo var. makuwa]|uniref:Uncharacterized protein n=1 Tax=Cucumis melo var. makuwa TaxID=1194695 RepID=A0A5D3BAK3_CUCMM|nr:uncharacterized protein E5676_scaffold110G002380 [Cucumis melo var. makuwa]
MRNGIIDSKDESNEHDAPFEEESDAHDDEYIQGACSMSLVTKRVLNLQIKEEKVEDQRENLFHTRCSIEETPCSLVIDSGSCTNVVTPRIFEVRAQRGADRREAGRTREGHMDASGFLIASAMYFVRIFGL